jgi:hypothetical protein
LRSLLMDCETANFGRISNAHLSDLEHPLCNKLGHRVIAIVDTQRDKRLQAVTKPSMSSGPTTDPIPDPSTFKWNIPFQYRLATCPSPRARRTIEGPSVPPTGAFFCGFAIGCLSCPHVVDGFFLAFEWFPLSTGHDYLRGLDHATVAAPCDILLAL